MILFRQICSPSRRLPKQKRWMNQNLSRVAPALGRGFLPEEEKPGAHVAVLGHELWLTQFGADPSVVGLTVPINGKPYTIRKTNADAFGRGLRQCCQLVSRTLWNASVKWPSDPR